MLHVIDKPLVTLSVNPIIQRFVSEKTKVETV